MGKPTPDMPSSGQPYEILSQHRGRLAYVNGDEGANCEQGGADHFGGDQSADTDSDY